MSDRSSTTDDAQADADDDRPPVACTITRDRAEERHDWMAEELVPAYEGFEEHDDGVTVRFAGVTDTLRHVARFVDEERQCCAFADYRIEVSPPYEETRLTIRGPEGAKELFQGEFVGRLQGEGSLEPPAADERFPNLEG